MTMIMMVMILLMTLFQELCSNGDLRNHLKSFEFVKTMTQVMQLQIERLRWWLWYFRGQRTKRSLKRCQSFQDWSAGAWISSEVNCHQDDCDEDKKLHQHQYDIIAIVQGCHIWRPTSWCTETLLLEMFSLTGTFGLKWQTLASLKRFILTLSKRTSFSLHTSSNSGYCFWKGPLCWSIAFCSHIIKGRFGTWHRGKSHGCAVECTWGNWEEGFQSRISSPLQIWESFILWDIIPLGCFAFNFHHLGNTPW